MSSVPNSSLVKSYFFKATGKPNGELVCYIAGFNTRNKSYEFANKTLQKMGYDVIFFNHHPAVLTAGNPQFLLDAADDISREVLQKSKTYSQVICMGVSLGTFLGYNVQKRVPKAHVGAFATGGVSFVPAVFSTRIFKKVAKAFTDNGYSREDLDKIWKPLDSDPAIGSFPPDKSFIVFDGMVDRIVRYKEAKRNIESWGKRGIRVKLYTLPRRGHLLTSIYFIRHTQEIVAKTKKHHLVTEPNPANS